MSRVAPALAALPRLIVGTSHLGSVLPDALVGGGARSKAFRYLDELLEMGYSAFDLAASYQVGGTERLVGQWLAARRSRSRLFLISKGGHPVPVIQPNRLTPAAIRADLEASLRRLGCDHIDLYLLHRDHPAADLPALAGVLSDEQRRGRIGAWGLSNWRHDRIRQMQAAVDQVAGEPLAASSVHFSLASWSRPPWPGCVSIAGDDGREARAFHADSGLPVLAWSPLGRGFLVAGEAGASTNGGASYASAANGRRRARAEELARSQGRSPAEVALAYLLHQPFPVHPIVASRSAPHMRHNLEACSLALGDADLRYLEADADRG